MSLHIEDVKTRALPSVQLAVVGRYTQGRLSMPCNAICYLDFASQVSHHGISQFMTFWSCGNTHNLTGETIATEWINTQYRLP